MNTKNRRITKIILLTISTLFTAVILGLGSFFLLVYYGAFGPLPKQDVLKGITNEEASLVYSADNDIIGKYFAKNRTNISWNEIPSHLKNALIATEDKRFFSHEGYDTRSYLRVFFRSILLRDKKSGGGSTLTQQLIKNLYGRNNFGFLSMPVNKVKEAIIAARMEKIYSKEELLLLYLNSVPFGEEVYGVESAARRFFNKPAHSLKVEESAVLVGLLKANTYFNPRLHPENSITRRNLVFKLMTRENYLTTKQADSLKKLPLSLDYENFKLEAPAGYFVYQVKKRTLQLLKTVKNCSEQTYNLEKDGLHIYTTLNLQVQQMAMGAVKQHMKQMQKLLDRELKNRGTKQHWIYKQQHDSLISKNDFVKRELRLFDWDSIYTAKLNRADSLWHYYKMLHAAVLITQPQSGAVISWIGGNHFRHLPFDMVLSHRQIASTFKPVLYATAFEEGFTPCSYLENEEKIYEKYNNWQPQNFNHISTPDSLVALWYALAHSMNLPSVDLYFKVGREKLISTCNKLGFPPIIDDVPSIALGTLDLSLYEIVRAYGVFANKGQFTNLVMIDRITDANGNELYARRAPVQREALDSISCEQINAILQTAINTGTGTKIRTQYGIKADLAGKTGTATNYSNAWFMAYTPNLVVGTWVGARTPDVHFSTGYGTGSSLALPIAGSILSELEKDAILNTRFLTAFEYSDSLAIALNCAPYQEKREKGLLEKLFHPEKEKQKANKEQQKEEKGLKKLFNKLFKKRK